MFNNWIKLFAISFCFVFSGYCYSISVVQFVENLPSNERKELEAFFRHLVAVSDFGYTLFGSKPMSMDAWSNEASLSYLFFPVVNNTTVIKNGWSLWMKYSHLFKGSRFCLRCCLHSNGKSSAIFLINRLAVARVINANIEAFKKYLGDHVTVSDILTGIERDQSILNDTLGGNEELLGILLGYGAVNSQKFQLRAELTQVKNSIPVFPKKLLVVNSDDPWERKLQRLEWQKNILVKGSRSVVMESEAAAHQLKSIRWEHSRIEDPLAQISLPSFRRVSNDAEGRQLLESYRQTRSSIISSLNSQNFLTTVLLEISK